MALRRNPRYAWVFQDGARMTDEKSSNDSYPRYYKWRNGIVRYNADGTRTWLTQWPDPEHPEAAEQKTSSD